jgi:hypothetical protein
METFEMWRLNQTTFHPEKVKVFPTVDRNFVLVEGDNHTTYRGSLFNSPADAFICAFADCERSIRYATQRKEKLQRAKNNYLLMEEL